MIIERVAVLREFEIVEDPGARQANDVFHASAHDPERDELTEFFRRFGAPRTQYKSNIIMDGVADIGSGEDPRPFYWRGSPCISAHTFSPGHGSINKVYVKTLDRWFTLIPPKNIVPGKNWSPFVRDDDLYFVHEYAPFRVLKADFLSEQDGFMVLDTIAEHHVKTPQSSDGFSRFRGGANALQIDDCVVGIGHTNDRVDETDIGIVHRPFVFVYKPDTCLDYYTFNFDFPDTYRIVDPTSLYLKDGMFFLMTCETETVWSVAPQVGRSCLYKMDLRGALDEDSIGFGGRRLHRWSHDQPSGVRRLLGAWRRS